MDDAEFAAGFVRDVLGCGCPDDVLRDIRLSRDLPGRLSALRLDVGGRLLVWALEGATGPATPGKIPEICAALRQQREQGRFNRARLVLEEPENTEVRAQIAGAFATAIAGDERLLIHMLPRQVILPLLSIGKSRANRH